MLTSISKEPGTKLVDFLYQQLDAKFSRRVLKQAIERNHCRVNGVTERFYSHQLRKGDRVEFDSECLEGDQPETIDVDQSRILFEDEYLLIYNKPSGLTSDENGLKKLFPDFHLIHRLDKETTGCLMLSKSQEVKQKMVDLFKEKKVRKSYLAVVDGVPKQKKGMIENFLGQVSQTPGNVKWGVVAPERGVHSKTEWFLEKRGKSASLLRLVPITGRTHQLRVHLNDLGHPILGDFRYCRTFTCPLTTKRTLLHSYTIQFPHPILDEFVTVQAPIPPDIKQAIRQVCK
jgi:23S rRNA pseudouridine955/2504/2580 synthase